MGLEDVQNSEIKSYYVLERERERERAQTPCDRNYCLYAYKH